MTRYSYPDADADRHAIDVHRLRNAWHQSRMDRDVALRAFLDAVRAEIVAETAFRAVVLDGDQ